jgi:hypothetical protein
MTTEMLIARYNDDGGGGFARARDAGNAPDQVWSFTRALIQRERLQIPSLIPSTRDYPLWTLQRVELASTPYWCFLVQARDESGSTGLCHFGLVPATVSAAEAWRAGRAQVAGRPERGEVAQAEVRDVLGGLALDGSRCVRVPGSPEQAAATIEAILSVVPPDVANRTVWSTCALRVPSDHKGVRRTVSGSWPEEFARYAQDLHQAAELAMGARTDYAGQFAVDHPEQVVALDGLVADAITGGATTRAMPGPIADMSTLLIRWRFAAKPLDDDLIWEYLHKPEAHYLLLNKLAALLAWVGRNLARALQYAKTNRDSNKPRNEILKELARLQASRKDNIIGLPTAATDASDLWLTQVRWAFTTAFPSDGDPTAGEAIGKLTNSGRPLADPAVCARAWTLWHGLIPLKRGDFRRNVGKELLALELNRGGMGEVAHEALGYLQDPLDDVRSVVESRGRDRRLAASLAADLVGRAHAQQVARHKAVKKYPELVRAVVQASAQPFGHGGRHWFDDFAAVLAIRHPNLDAETGPILQGLRSEFEQRAMRRHSAPAPVPVVPGPETRVAGPIGLYETGTAGIPPIEEADRTEFAEDERGWHFHIPALAAFLGLVVLVVVIVAVFAVATQPQVDRSGPLPLPRGEATSEPGPAAPVDSAQAPVASAPPPDPGNPAPQQVVSLPDVAVQDRDKLLQNFDDRVRQAVGSRPVDRIVVVWIDNDLNRARAGVNDFRDKLVAAWAGPLKVPVETNVQKEHLLGGPVLRIDIYLSG